MNLKQVEQIPIWIYSFHPLLRADKNLMLFMILKALACRHFFVRWYLFFILLVPNPINRSGPINGLIFLELRRPLISFTPLKNLLPKEGPLVTREGFKDRTKSLWNRNKQKKCDLCSPEALSQSTNCFVYFK